MTNNESQQLELVEKLENDTLSLPREITTEDDAFIATDTLLKVRKMFNEIEEKRKERTAPANETIKLINEDYKKYLKPLAEIEKTLSKALAEYANVRTAEDLKKLDIVRADTGDHSLVIPIGLKSIPSMSGEVRFRQGFSARVVDATKVPRKFKTTVIDMKALEQVIDEAEGLIDIPGVEIVRTNSVAIYAK